MEYSEPVTVPAQWIVAHFLDGNEIGWAEELEWLWSWHRREMTLLLEDVLLQGFREPIVIGYDWRVWDGHHRIAVALALHRPLPVIVATNERGALTHGNQDPGPVAFLHHRAATVEDAQAG